MKKFEYKKLILDIYHYLLMEQFAIEKRILLDKNSGWAVYEKGSSSGYPIRRNMYVALSGIDMCYFSSAWRRYSSGYIISGDIIGIKDGSYLGYVTNRRIPEFESNFPVFPYDKQVYIANLLDKRINNLETQMVAMLSHIETIMIFLGQRSVLSDNLNIVPPESKLQSEI